MVPYARLAGGQGLDRGDSFVGHRRVRQTFGRCRTSQLQSFQPVDGAHMLGT